MKIEKFLNSSLLLIIASIALSNAGIAAEHKELKKLSLRNAIETGLKNNPDYKIAVIKQRAAKERVNSAWGQLLPVIESEASALGQYAPNGMMSKSDGGYDIRILQVKFGINPGIFANTLLFHQKAHLAAAEDVKKIKSEVTAAIIKSYFSLLVAEELVSLRKETIRLYQENLKDVENLYRTGSVPKFDLLQTQVRLKSQEPALLEAENIQRVSLEMFNYNLGSNDVSFTVDGSILNTAEYRLPKGESDKIINRYTVAALKNRPELMQIKLKKEMSGHMKNLYNSYWIWPTFTVAGNIGYTKNLLKPIDPSIPAMFQPVVEDLLGNSEWQNTWQIRVAATYRWSSLLPVESNWANKREEKIKMEQADAELIKLQRLIGISIKSCYSDLITAYYTIKSQKENVEKADEGLRIARESFRSGIIKNSDLLASQLALTEAKTGHINAVNKYYMAIADLQKEMGTDDDGIIFGGSENE